MLELHPCESYKHDDICIGMELAEALCRIETWSKKGDTDAFLDLTLLGLTELPPIPPTVEAINISMNRFSILPALPDSVKRLYCSYNFLTSIDVLPPNLEILYCDNNYICEISCQLPATVQLLYCKVNRLIRLPIMDNSSNIDCIDCQYNKLTKIHALPDNLRTLLCGHNKLSTLPCKLPVNLSCLNIHVNSLMTLPRMTNDICVNTECDHVFGNLQTCNKFLIKHNIHIINGANMYWDYYLSEIISEAFCA